MKSKSKVKGQKSKVKSYGTRWRAAFLPADFLGEAHTGRIETLLPFDFCLLTFDLPFKPGATKWT
jgi:hypothetical protein